MRRTLTDVVKSYAVSATKAQNSNQLHLVGGHWQVENGEYIYYK